MEAISLFKIIENTGINNVDHLIFVHDCDLTDEKIIKEYLPKAIIKFVKDLLVIAWDNYTSFLFPTGFLKKYVIISLL